MVGGGGRRGQRLHLRASGGLGGPWGASKGLDLPALMPAGRPELSVRQNESRLKGTRQFQYVSAAPATDHATGPGAPVTHAQATLHMF